MHKSAMLHFLSLSFGLGSLGTGAAACLTKFWGGSGNPKLKFIVGISWTCAALCIACLLLGKKTKVLIDYLAIYFKNDNKYKLFSIKIVFQFQQ